MQRHRSFSRARLSGVVRGTAILSLDSLCELNFAVDRARRPNNPMLPSALSPRQPSRPHPVPAALLRRICALTICITAALALNALAIGAFAEAASRSQAPSAGAAAVSWITAVTVDDRSKAYAAEQNANALDLTHRDRLTAIDPTLEGPQPSSAVAPMAPASSAEDGSFVRFYRSSEVDRPAEPDSDWNLDAATLDAAGIESLVFDIFIDRDGTVVGCSIVEPSGLAVDTQQALEARLQGTVVTPALREGAAVASVRRIEVSVLPGLR